MKTYWLRLGRSDAISRVTLIVVVLVQTSGSFITSLVDYSGRVPEFLMIRAAAFAAMFLVLGIGKLVLKSSLDLRYKPFFTVAIFLFASVSAVYVDDTLLQFANFSSESRFLQRLGLSLVGLPLAMIVTAMIVTGVREYTAKIQALAETSELLFKTRSEATSKIASRKVELIERIEGEIAVGLSNVNPQNNPISIDEMKSLLDDVVRPLSYQLDRDIALVEVRVNGIPQPNVKWRSVFRRTVSEGNPFHPFATAAWPTLTSTSFVLANFGAIGIPTGLAFFAIYSCLTWVARKLWLKVPTSFSPALRAFFITIIFGVIAWAGAEALSIPAGGQLLAGGKIIFWIAFMEVVSWTVALLFTANRLLKDVTEQLLETNDELKREVISLNSSLRLLQRGISRVLHGPVQQAIAASIFRLQSTHAGSEDPSVMEEVKLLISMALNQLKDVGPRPRDLASSFAEIEELWTGVAIITVDVPQTDLGLIQEIPQTTQAVYELVSEACVNAIKHGEPTRISFTIAADKNQKLVKIIKRSDGKPLLTSGRSGLGTQLLDETCLSWKRFQEGQLVVLEMVIPLQETPFELDNRP